MEKVIYENDTNILKAKASNEGVLLTELFDGEVIGEVTLFSEEIKELSELINNVY
ncbi:hypothetical protein [Bacillus sp. AFS040349]|uniref:hypothetical protein n=1 Tax=Bacillus sp. AFS040349 TaxID=2033502 RepID=UPI00159BA512|nr:hypothetical protein [Bacillus sp. AFS040349]